MTLVSDIITDAFRQSNLIALGTTPTTAENTEALRYVNRIVKSVLGNEVGDPLTSFPLGKSQIVRPSNFPSWNQNPGSDWVVPRNIRLNVNLTAALTVYLNPMPNDGCRFAVSDAVNTLGTYPLTVMGNGRFIEGAATLVLNTPGTETEWVFRADTGNWQKVTPLLLADTFPFPEEFDDFFIVLLALKINPSNGLQLDPQSQQTMMRARTQLRARYRQYSPSRAHASLRELGGGSLGPSQPSFGDAPYLFNSWRDR